jgi:drug/metabolite transporter (DMT)-like permease
MELSHIPPFLLLGAGLSIGGLAGAGAITRQGLTPRVVLLGVYGLFAYHFCFFKALRLAPPLEAYMLNSLWPLLIVVLSPLFLGGGLSVRHVGGAVLGFSGAFLLVGRGIGAADASWAGYAFALAASLIWSTYTLMTKRLGGVPTSAVSVFCLISGALSLICHALFEPSTSLSAADAPRILAIGLGPMGAAFYLWDRAIKDGDPRAIGTLSYLTPLLSTLMLAAFGHGELTAAVAVAGALIVGGAALGSR